MPRRKEYYCRICHKHLTAYRPVRLVKQVHDNKETYGAFHFSENFDFCKGCFRIFEAWIKKHEAE